MIVFGVAVTRSEDYERWAGPGIDGARECDSEVYANSSPGSIFRAYNLLLDQAAEHDRLEALVLLHQDVEIVDEDFCAKVRRVFSDPDVAIAGCVGARDARTMAWWEGAVTWASFTHRYYEHGGGILPAFSMSPETGSLPAYARLGEVDTIDGFIMVLSPWAVRNLRFDETLGRFHGYDFDLCMQARAAGLQGRDRRPEGLASPFARAHARPGDLDRGQHPPDREVGEPRWRRWRGSLEGPGAARRGAGIRRQRAEDLGEHARRRP